MCRRSFFKTESGSGLSSSSLTFERLSFRSKFLRGFVNERNSDPPSILWMRLFHIEVVKTVLQGRIGERTCEQGGVIKVSKISSQDRLDVPVPPMMEQLREVPEMVSQDRIQRRTAEQIVDVPVSKVFSEFRVRQRFVEQNIENPVDEPISQIM